MNTNVLCVSEPGLYKLIFKSRKEEAEAFQDWVFEEVLPAIRKTGRYAISEEEDRQSKDSRNVFVSGWSYQGFSKQIEYKEATRDEFNWYKKY